MNNEHEVGNLSKNGLIFNALDLSHFNLENFAALRENGPVQTPPPPKVWNFPQFFYGFPYAEFSKNTPTFSISDVF